MHIALVYNARPENYERTDPKLEEFIEGDEWKTTKAQGDALARKGHQVTYISVDQEIYKKLKSVVGKVDLVLNMAEGLSGRADREAHIPMLCEIVGLPYTGPGPLSAALILNKGRAKEIWKANSVRTTASLSLNDKLTYPVIVKPNSEGSGIGIKDNSIVHSKKELTTAVNRINKEYRQDALIEPYLSGREFTVAIVGNGEELEVLPLIEINFAAFPKDAPAIDSYEAKFIYGATGEAEMHETEFCPAIVDKKLEREIVDLAKRAYQTIGCRDFGRVDIRLDEHNTPHVLEINYPPGLMSDPEESSFFTIAARVKGWSFEDLMERIITTACKRLGIGKTN